MKLEHSLTPTHIIIKLLKTKDKEKILKALRETTPLPIREKTMRMIADI